MSHFGRSGPPDIKDTYSLLVLNLSFRTSADDLYPLFAKYGKVVDVFIPRDKRTGDSRGFAFVRYKYAEEAQEAVDHLDGRRVDGRDIMVQFAKYGPTGESIKKGKVSEMVSRTRGRSRSRSPRPRYRGDYHGRDYRRHSRSRSRDRYDRDKYQARQKEYRRRSRSRSGSPDRSTRQTLNRADDGPQRRGSPSFDRSPMHRSRSPYQSPSPHRSRNKSPKVHRDERSPDQQRAHEGNSHPGSPMYHERDRSPLRRHDERSPSSISPRRRHDERSPSSISPRRRHDERSPSSTSPRRRRDSPSRSPRGSDAYD